jgi:hypothetical protein
MKTIIVVLFALAVACHVAGAWAEEGPTPPPSRGAQAALEAGSIVGTAAYVPIKGLLCAVTLGTTPLLYVSSGPRAVRTVTNRACNGTWIITPEVLKGEKPFAFVEETPCCGYPEP